MQTPSYHLSIISSLGNRNKIVKLCVSETIMFTLGSPTARMKQETE